MKNRSYQGRIMRVIALPMRVLCRARDMYVNGMNNYADRAACYNGGCGAATWGPTGDPLPRSFSTKSMRSSDEAERDLRELVRLASKKALFDLAAARGSSKEDVAAKTGVPRSASVCMKTIEEDKACEFGGDIEWDLKKTTAMKKKKKKSTFGAGGGGIPFPRSRTCAAGSTRMTSF